MQRPKAQVLFSQVFKMYLLINGMRRFTYFLGHYIFLIVGIGILGVTISNNDNDLAPQFYLAIVINFFIMTLMFSSENLVIEDFRIKVWEQYMLTGVWLEYILIAKILAQTLISYVIALLILPLVSLILAGVNYFSFDMLFIGLPMFLMLILSIITFASSLTLASGRGNIIAGVIILPLTIPTSIAFLKLCDSPKYNFMLLGLILALIPTFLWGASRAIALSVRT